jgi:hypothetical protein
VGSAVVSRGFIELIELGKEFFNVSDFIHNFGKGASAGIGGSRPKILKPL